MNTPSVVHFAKSGFWTIDRHSKSLAMRRYRSLWRGLDLQCQWALECNVYVWRGRGITEEAINQLIEGTLNAARPWRMSDAKLKQVFWKRRRPRHESNSR